MLTLLFFVFTVFNSDYRRFVDTSVAFINFPKQINFKMTLLRKIFFLTSDSSTFEYLSLLSFLSKKTYIWHLVDHRLIYYDITYMRYLVIIFRLCNLASTFIYALPIVALVLRMSSKVSPLSSTSDSAETWFCRMVSLIFDSLSF